MLILDFVADDFVRVKKEISESVIGTLDFLDVEEVCFDVQFHFFGEPELRESELPGAEHLLFAPRDFLFHIFESNHSIDSFGKHDNPHADLVPVLDEFKIAFVFGEIDEEIKKL